MPAAVRLRQSLAHLRGDVDGVVEVERAPSNPLLQRLALVVGHDEVQLPVVCLVDLKDGADVGMVQG